MRAAGSSSVRASGVLVHSGMQGGPIMHAQFLATLEDCGGLLLEPCRLQRGIPPCRVR